MRASRSSRSFTLDASATIAMISLAGMMTKRSSRTHAVGGAAESDDHLAQRAVVHVDRARPRDAARIDAERVALLQVVVEHRREQRVRARDGVEVAREVQVDVVHRQHLRVTAAGGASLHAEDRAERGLADAQRDALVRGGGTPAPVRRTSWSCPSPAGVGLIAVTSTSLPRAGRSRDLERDLGLVLPVEIEIVRRQVQLSGDVDDRAQLRVLCDFDIRGNGHGMSDGEMSDGGYAATRSRRMREARNLGSVLHACQSEEPSCILQGDFTHLITPNAPRQCHPGHGQRNVRRFVALPAKRHRREVGGVGFHQDAVGRNRPDQVIVGPLPECHDAAEGHVPPAFECNVGE